jgi:plastocyanin
VFGNVLAGTDLISRLDRQRFYSRIRFLRFSGIFLASVELGQVKAQRRLPSRRRCGRKGGNEMSKHVKQNLRKDGVENRERHKSDAWNRGSRLLAALCLACALMTVAVKHPVSAAQGNPDKNQIKIDNFSFSPAELTVPANTQVTWVNRDDVPHTVVSTDKKFKSQALDTDETFSFTFTEPGTYEYFCSVHPRMVGKIIVQSK